MVCKILDVLGDSDDHCLGGNFPMDPDRQEITDVDPFELAQDLTLESDESDKETFSDRNGCNTARGQSGTRWI